MDIKFAFYADPRDDPHYVRCRVSGHVHDNILPTAALIRSLAKRGKDRDLVR